MGGGNDVADVRAVRDGVADLELLGSEALDHERAGADGALVGPCDAIVGAVLVHDLVRRVSIPSSPKS